MTDAPPILAAHGVSFSYRPDRPLLQDIDITARQGELTCLLGPNGSGKTTLLRCLLGQLPAGGEVLLDGRPIDAYTSRDRARKLAYVPQFPQAAFAFTCRQIVMMGRHPRAGTLGLTGEEDRKVVDLAMQMTQTTDFAPRTLDELSGGEAQRVMIARALAQQPAVCLLDEPTSHLDLRNQLLIYQMMQRLAHDWRMAVLSVSHDVNQAAQFADRLVLMRNGALLADGPPGEVLTVELLRQTYDVDVELIDRPDSNIPIVHARPI